MKAKDVYNTYVRLRSVADKKLPIKIAFIVSRNLKKMQSVAQDVDTNRAMLFEKYGERKDDGSLDYAEDGSLAIPKEFINSFADELMEIMNAEINITLDPLTEEDIEKCDGDGYDRLTVDEIGALMLLTGDAG